MRYQVEAILIATNMLDDVQERERIKRELLEDLATNHPEVLHEMTNVF